MIVWLITLNTFKYWRTKQQEEEGSEPTKNEYILIY